MNLSLYFLKDSRLTLLLVCLIMVSGLSSFFLLPRMEDPILIQRAGFVNTALPGADPSRVESLVTEKIENELHEIDEIKEIRSSSQEGFSAISIELRDDVYDAERVWSKLRDRLDDVSSQLPAGATKPQYVEIDFKAFAVLVGLTWDRDSEPNYAILTRWAKQLEEKLRSVPGTEKVQLYGDPDEEIQVLLDSSRSSSLGLSASDVAGQLRNSDSKISAGLVRGTSTDLLIEIAGEFDSLGRIEQIPIYYGNLGNFVRLGDIAEVKKTIITPQIDKAIVSGKTSVTVGAFVRPNFRIDNWSKNCKSALEEFKQTLPEGIGLDVVFDQNGYVESRLSALFLNLLIGGTAVFLVIWILMGWRNAIVVSLALPLASLMVLTSMRLQNIPIHQMSITGLIIALGLLIDNAIVVVDEVSSKLRKGLSATDAVRKSISHLFLPLLGSTLTTALAFGPIALMPGPAGDFVGSIATNVIVAIFSSFFLAMTIVPAIAAKLNQRPENNRKTSWLRDGIYFEKLDLMYSHFVDWILRRPVMGILIGMLFPMIGFFQAQHLDEQFFPPADRDQLNIEIELSPQASVGGTNQIANEMRQVLLDQDCVKRVDWFVGESAPAFYYNLIARKRNTSQYAQAIVQLQSSENLPVIIRQLQNKMDRRFPQARVLVRQLEQGPPFDAPIEIRIFGPDLNRLRTIGTQVRQVLADTPGVIHIRSELDEVLPKIELAVREENARASGLNLASIAQQVDAWTEGAVGGSLVEATEELPVRVRLSDENRDNLTSLSSIDLVNSNTNSATNDNQYRGIPLTALANVELTADFGSIPHLAGRRMNELQVYIPAGVLPAEVLNRFKGRFANSDIEFPPGYKMLFGGEAAKRDEAIGNLMANVGVLLVLMIATLVLSFGSFRLAGIIGVIGALSVGLGMGSLWLYGFPFGFMAIVGTMGLIGVAINDSIVVLASIRENEAAKNGDRLEIRNAIRSSTRHIISTSLTTMAGFTPLILSGGGFWPPLAITIAGGVGGATILALIFVPSAYILVKCKRLPASQSKRPSASSIKRPGPASTQG